MEQKHKRAYDSLMYVMYGVDNAPDPDHIVNDAHPVGAIMHEIMMRVGPHTGSPEPDLMLAVQKTIKANERMLVAVEYGMFLTQSGTVDWPTLMSSFGMTTWSFNLVTVYHRWGIARIEAKFEARLKAMEEARLQSDDNYRMQIDAIYAEMETENIDSEAFNTKVAKRLGLSTVSMKD